MLSPTQRTQARYVIRKYLERCEANRLNIHYSQIRPFSLGRPPNTSFWGDCSSYAICAYYWADLWCAFKVKDPGGWNYTGIGNTQTILATNRTRRVSLDHKFFIGDMALFGSWGDTKHVTICRKGGDERTSIWSSHGSESGPLPTLLHYRSDLVVVVRSESLA